MRKVILKMHVSLDGYVRAASGDVMGWIFRTYDDQLKAWEVEMLWKAGTHIMGRNLYDEMAAYWPDSTEVYAEPMNTIPKVVFSKTLKQADWVGTRIVNGDLAAEIARMKNEPGKDILAHGGAAFAKSLSKLGLIDEYRLILHPLVLSAGLPLFAEPADLKLQESTVFPCGSILLVYGRA
jgi:dihydrofolate reductase